MVFKIEYRTSMVDKFYYKKTIKGENNEAIILFLRYNNNNEIGYGEKKRRKPQ